MCWCFKCRQLSSVAKTTAAHRQLNPLAPHINTCLLINISTSWRHFHTHSSFSSTFCFFLSLASIFVSRIDFIGKRKTYRLGTCCLVNKFYCVLFSFPTMIYLSSCFYYYFRFQAFNMHQLSFKILLCFYIRSCWSRFVTNCSWDEHVEGFEIS